MSGSRDTTFRAVADPTRRAILDALARNEMSVGDLCALFHVTQPAVSQHLAVLRDAGLVRARQQGRQRIYALDAEPLREVHDWAAHHQRFWTAKLDALSQVLAREAAKTAKATTKTVNTTKRKSER